MMVIIWTIIKSKEWIKLPILPTTLLPNVIYVSRSSLANFVWGKKKKISFAKSNVPKRKENAAGAYSGDPHEPASPPWHRVLLFLPSFKSQFCRDIPDQQTQAKDNKTDQGNRQANDDLQPLVDPLNVARVVAERVHRGGRRHVQLLAPKRSKRVARTPWGFAARPTRMVVMAMLVIVISTLQLGGWTFGIIIAHRQNHLTGGLGREERGGDALVRHCWK